METNNYTNNQRYQRDLRTESPLLIEKNLDSLIRKNMRGESSFSPLNYYPEYQEDKLSRFILHGNRGIINPKTGNMPDQFNNGYFSSIQHKYLNEINFQERMWNLNKDAYNNNLNKYEDKRNQNVDVININANKNLTPNNKLAQYGQNLISSPVNNNINSRTPYIKKYHYYQ